MSKYTDEEYEEGEETEETEGEGEQTEGEEKKEKKPELPPLGLYVGARDEAGKRTGKAKMQYTNGDTYDGEYLDGLRHGQGVGMF